MNPCELKSFIQAVFHHVIESMDVKEETYHKYFSEDYIQYVDGHQLTFTDFVAHIKAQKLVIKSAKLSYKHIIAENDKVSIIHIVDAVKKDRSVIKAQVNALFQIKNNKIILCDELTYLIQGDKSDKDIGSRH